MASSILSICWRLGNNADTHQRRMLHGLDCQQEISLAALVSAAAAAAATPVSTAAAAVAAAA